jgi:integrase
MAKLPTAKYNLRLPKAKSETLISLIFRYNGKRLVYSTGYSIHPEDWNFTIQRPFIQKGRTDLIKIKRDLDELASLCLDIFIKHDYGSIDLDEFRSQLDISSGKTESSEIGEGSSSIYSGRLSFFEFIDQELEGMEAAKMKYSSLRVFQRHTTILKEFAEEVFPSKRCFDYEDVDWNFRLKLIDWLAEQNFQLAYGNKTLKTLRQFLEKARRQKIHSNTDYQGAGWMVAPKKAKGQIVILSLEEFNVLANLELSGHLEKVRDICLIGAGTGQRYSDFSRYVPDNFYKTINGIPILSVISQKTDTPAKIPLNIFHWLIPVLEKHEYSTPQMSMQKFNDGLKELCNIAGFEDRILQVKQYIGRKARIEKAYLPKYELVSSHICRRSFATNMYRMGYRLSQIMPMTGHSTESQLRKYLGMDSEQNAEEIGLGILQSRKEGTYTGSNLKVVNS